MRIRLEVAAFTRGRVQRIYDPDLAVHWQRCEAEGLQCPLEVFTQLFHSDAGNACYRDVATDSKSPEAEPESRLWVAGVGRGQGEPHAGERTDMDVRAGPQRSSIIIAHRVLRIKARRHHNGDGSNEHAFARSAALFNGLRRGRGMGL
jgi:hypothetical protein